MIPQHIRDISNDDLHLSETEEPFQDVGESQFFTFLGFSLILFHGAFGFRPIIRLVTFEGIGLVDIQHSIVFGLFILTECHTMYIFSLLGQLQVNKLHVL